MICDATFLVDLARGDPGARDFLERAEAGSEAVRVASPALAKVAASLGRSRHPPRELPRVLDLLRDVDAAPLAGAHAMRAGDVIARAAVAGVPIDAFDAMTAAVAIEEDEALVTRNARDFAWIEGLRLATY